VRAFVTSVELVPSDVGGRTDTDTVNVRAPTP
jgi:hypothetical protein